MKYKLVQWRKEKSKMCNFFGGGYLWNKFFFVFLPNLSKRVHYIINVKIYLFLYISLCAHVCVYVFPSLSLIIIWNDGKLIRQKTPQWRSVEDIITLCQVTSFLFRNTSYLYLQRQHDSSLKNCYNVGNIRQKVVSQNGCFKKTKHPKFSKKNEHFLPPDTHTWVYCQW